MMTEMQRVAISHPCLLPEETAHPRFAIRTSRGTLVLTALQQERARADWWDAETRRILRAVWAEGVDTTHRVVTLALSQRPADEQHPPAKCRDYTREERDDNSPAVLTGETHGT